MKPRSANTILNALIISGMSLFLMGTILFSFLITREIREDSSRQEAMMLTGALKQTLGGELLSSNFYVASERIAAIIDSAPNNDLCVQVKDANAEVIFTKDDQGVCRNPESKLVSEKVFFDSNETSLAFEINTHYVAKKYMTTLKNSRLIRTVVIPGLILFAFLMFSLFALSMRFSNWVFGELRATVEGKRAYPSLFFGRYRIRELQVIGSQVHALNEATKAQATAHLAQQVSHDIRSPLSALEMMLVGIRGLDEDQRLILRNSINRIRDIANTLGLRKYETLVEKSEDLDLTRKNSGLVELDELLISPIIDVLVTEKRLEYRDRLNVTIEFNPGAGSYGLFARLDAKVLTRILSNLINNSVESLKAQAGYVRVDLNSNINGKIEIQIADNGVGIDRVTLSKLGVRGATFNKKGGSGLGLAHAKEAIEGWGGQLVIDSDVGVGTKVQVNVPKGSAPDWFLPVMKIGLATHVVIFDDDQSIHQIWKGRLESLGIEGLSSRILHLSTPAQFRAFYRKEFFNLDSVIFLVDYEILGHSGESGLDLIEECGIANIAVLVTSRYEEPEIRERCKSLGVKLIPKSMSGFVPIQIS
jgi:signal transduction histidine kinase